MESVSTSMRDSLRQFQFLSDLKNSCEHAVQEFYIAVKLRALKSSLLGVPLLPRRNGRFSSVVNGSKTWPRRASRGSREQSSPNAQPASSPARRYRHCRSFPAPGLTFAPFNATQWRSKYSPDIPKASRPTSLLGDGEEALPVSTLPASQNKTSLNIAVSSDYDTFWNDVMPDLHDFVRNEEFDIYMKEGIQEWQQRSNCCSAPEMPQGDAWVEDLPEFVGILTSSYTTSETEQEGAGDSSVATHSENETASSSAASEEPAGGQRFHRRFRGVRLKDNKWISEIRPSCAKRTVWLGTYATEEEAARAFDAGIFYYRKFTIPYNFPDSPEVLPEVIQGPQEVSAKFVKTEARKNAQRARPSPDSSHQLLTTAIQEQASSSSGSSRQWFRGCRGRKSYSQ
jgi:hypothetical protein